MGLGGLEQPPDRVARARGGVQRAGVAAQARRRPSTVCAPVTVSSSPRPSCSSMPQAEERLQAPPEAAARAAHALGDRAHPPPMGRVQVQDAVGLAVAHRAQHDRLGLDWSGHGPFESRLASGAPFARLPVAQSHHRGCPPGLGQRQDPRQLHAILYEVMSEITVYTTEPCSFCARVKGLLEGPWQSSSPRSTCPRTPTGRVELAQQTGMMTFPQVVDRRRAARRLHRGSGGRRERRDLDELLARLDAASCSRRASARRACSRRRGRGWQLSHT